MNLERVRIAEQTPDSDFEGRLHLTVETDPFEILFMGEHHARELITATFTMDLINTLTKGYAAGDPAIRIALVTRAEQPSTLVREHVAWALAQHA